MVLGKEDIDNEGVRAPVPALHLTRSQMGQTTAEAGRTKWMTTKLILVYLKCKLIILHLTKGKQGDKG